MAHTTYTLLVTIAHDDGAAPSTDLLDVMVKRGLEEGVREFAGVYAAEVDSLVGDHMAAQVARPGSIAAGIAGDVCRVKGIHATLHA